VEQARRNLSASDRRAAQQQVATIKKCLGQDTWCRASTKEENDKWREQNKNTKNPNAVPPGFVEVKGDPGNAFTDSRELIYHQADKASRGPLDQYMRTMRSADFKPGMKMYDQLQRDVNDAKTRVDAFRKSEEQDPEKRFIRNGNWDSRRQSVNQMSQSARDVERSLGTRTTGAYKAKPGDNSPRRPASRPPMGAIGSPNSPQPAQPSTNGPR
jgi:hypothetical protein